MIRTYHIKTSRTGTIRKLLVGLTVGVVIGYLLAGVI